MSQSSLTTEAEYDLRTYFHDKKLVDLLQRIITEQANSEKEKMAHARGLFYERAAEMLYAQGAVAALVTLSETIEAISNEAK